MENAKTVTKKVWIGCNELIERNSKEETFNELYGSGYIAKLSAAIERRERQIKEEEQAKRERAQMRAAMKAKREAKKAQQEEMEM